MKFLKKGGRNSEISPFANTHACSRHLYIYLLFSSKEKRKERKNAVGMENGIFCWVIVNNKSVGQRVDCYSSSFLDMDISPNKVIVAELDVLIRQSVFGSGTKKSPHEERNW